MRPVTFSTAAALLTIGAATLLSPAGAEAARLKSCGKVVAATSSDRHPHRMRGYVYASGLPCRDARVSIRTIVPGMAQRDSASFVVRTYGWDCERSFRGTIPIRCLGARPQDRNPTLSLQFRTKRRR